MSVCVILPVDLNEAHRQFIESLYVMLQLVAAGLSIELQSRNGRQSWWPRGPNQRNWRLTRDCITTCKNRLEGKVHDAEGREIDGPRQAPFKGRNKPHRSDRKWVNGWSPEQISNRLQIDFPDNESMRISHEAIYQALYIKGRGSSQTRTGELVAHRESIARTESQGAGQSVGTRQRGFHDLQSPC